MSGSLPVECWMKVLENLTFHDLFFSIPNVCWDLSSAAKDDKFWKKLYVLHFQVVLFSHRDDVCFYSSWRQRYVERKSMVAAKGLVEFYELHKTLLYDPCSFSRNNVMYMYTTVFHFCISNFRMRDYGTNHEGLYDALVHKCESHLDDVYIEACSMPLGLPLLEFYVDAWSTFQNTLKRCNIVFAYFQRDYQSRHAQHDNDMMFARMVNTYIANTQYQSSAVLGVVPMMVVNWHQRMLGPLAHQLMHSISLFSVEHPTTKKLTDCLFELIQFSQCKTLPKKDLCLDLISRLGCVVGEDVGMEEEVVVGEVREGWIGNAGVAVQ